jgi:hypothetical protein
MITLNFSNFLPSLSPDGQLTLSIPLRTASIFTEDYVDTLKGILGPKKAMKALDKAAERLYDAQIIQVLADVVKNRV